ncbi:MAG: cobalamin-binding protein [Armatimonadota bacterium]|nr:cobalamin-binding protein [Armatimonadota bacterium]MDR7455495.1 cobalamin-binding protein [Armatimonadota bacterium]MDR7456754.1 cobalamin-binding protein [Armatimonadota bacterium]MDR7497790.1 cobalamin-binding protein [Armatimonadota bacterium]MDR7510486.1 cobalamin-binding protein [Armatimonadota bacterium]
MRIVSLLPSATEIVCALGLGDALVGISHDCDYPAEVLDRRVLSTALVDPSQPSAAIDAAVRDRVHRGTSVYHLDAAGLEALRPDLILTQELCEVCAPSFTEVRRAARVLEGRTRLVSLEPLGLDDILDTIALVGDLTGAARTARALVSDLRARIEAVRRLPPPEPRPRVLCVEWLDPLFVAGHWVPEMVAIAGGEDGLGRPRASSVTVPWEAVVAYAPELIVLMPCGFDLERTRAEAPLLARRPGWDALPAVRAGRVYATDGSAYFNRPGPRVVGGLEILAALVREEGGPPRAEGVVRLDAAA